MIYPPHHTLWALPLMEGTGIIMTIAISLMCIILLPTPIIVRPLLMLVDNRFCCFPTTHINKRTLCYCLPPRMCGCVSVFDLGKNLSKQPQKLDVASHVKFHYKKFIGPIGDLAQKPSECTQ